VVNARVEGKGMEKGMGLSGSYALVFVLLRLAFPLFSQVLYFL